MVMWPMLIAFWRVDFMVEAREEPPIPSEETEQQDKDACRTWRERTKELPRDVPRQRRQL
jgi:hypothetical protein